jgi:hypothetical protein
MDEPPFIDTDIGRGTILFNREDFEFIIRENNMKPIEVGEKTRYILINFIEVGGDHLDRIIKNIDHKNNVKELIFQTKEILKHVHQMIYFINFKELVNTELGNFDNSKFDQISLRMSYLKSEFPLIKNIHFVISRYDKQIANTVNYQILLSEIRKKKKFHHNLDQSNSFLLVLREYLNYLNYKDNWKINLSVTNCDHILSDNSLNVNGILKTFTNLFDKKVFYSEELSQSHVIVHLLNFFNVYSIKKKKNVFWITNNAFKEYVAKLDFKELPESIIYQNFLYIKEILINNNYCINLTPNNKPQFEIILQIYDQLENKIENWTLKYQWEETELEKFRFPNYLALFDFIYQFIRNNIPVDFWFKENRFVFSKEAINLSKEIFEELIKEINKNLDLFFHGKENLNVLVALIEDYYLGQNIINPLEITSKVKIPSETIISRKSFSKRSLFFEKDLSTNTTRQIVTIPIKLIN